MMKIKKLIILILVIALCASLASVAYAKSGHHGGRDGKDGKCADVLSADVQTLKTLGILTGTGKDGLSLEYTKSKPTRLQGFIIYLRLINQELDFDHFTYRKGDDTFDDHHGHSSYAQRVMAYAKAHPELKWVGSNGRFNPLAHLTAREYAKIMLVALGYEYNDDFTWKNVERFAEELGLNVPEGAFTINALATMTVQTLYTEMKGTGQKLIDYLASVNPEFAEKVAKLGDTPTTDTTKPSVTDVVLSTPYSAGPPVVNGRVTIYFSEAMKADTLTSLSNYTVDLDGSGPRLSVRLSCLTRAAAAASADKKSVTLTIPDSLLAGGPAAGPGVTDITISGLTDLKGNVIDPVTKYVRFAAVLTIVSGETQDLDKDGYLDAIKLTFSKSIKDSTVNANNFDVAGYSYEVFYPGTAGDTADDNVIYITFLESDAADTGATPTISYTQGTLEDMSGNKLAATGALVTTDKAAPAVLTALPAGVLTAGGPVSSATLVLSEDITAANRETVLTVVRTHIALNDQGTPGDLVKAEVWTTGKTLTVAITGNMNGGGVNPDSISLSAALTSLIDASGNIAADAQVIRQIA